MNTSTKIPNGDETVTIELTVKELMTLAGVRFRNNPGIEVSARKKIHAVLDQARERNLQDVENM